MALLVEFILRLAFGLAAGMSLTSPRQITSGYYRNHLYVTLGLATLAALLSRTVAPAAFWPAVVTAAISYIGSVCWLAERPRAGRFALVLVTVAALWGALEVAAVLAELRQLPELRPTLDDQQIVRLGTISGGLGVLSTVSSGLLLGITMAAMLLGHWYLNSPTMELAPLRMLILVLAAALLLQVILSTMGLVGEIFSVEQLSTRWVFCVLMRWLFGLVGVALLTWMAWQTLKIPNTQSATGILYVAVIGTFVGETMALLLSAESLFPL